MPGGSLMKNGAATGPVMRRLLASAQPEEGKDGNHDDDQTHDVDDGIHG